MSSELAGREKEFRDHLEIARERIEADRMVEAIKPLGFRYVSLDLEGYRTGALNEVLWPPQKQGE